MSSYMDPLILEFLREHPEGATAAEIAQAVVGSPGAYLPTIKRSAVWKRCARLAEDGVLVESRVHTRTPGGCQCSCSWRLAL